MSIVAGYFMTIVSSQTWNRNTFNLKLHEFKIFRDGHILCSLLFQRSTKHIWPLWWYDDDDDWFASLWWEHRNILENCAITLCWGETSSKLCIVVKTELSLLCGLATAKQAPVESTILSDYTRWNVTFFFCAAFFLKNFRLFLRIKMMLFLIKILSHDGWDL